MEPDTPERVLAAVVSIIGEKELEAAIRYAEQKARLAGKGPDYIPYLLPDVIRERAVHRAYAQEYATRIPA